MKIKILLNKLIYFEFSIIINGLMFDELVKDRLRDPIV
jgi:hypothetical protein